MLLRSGDVCMFIAGGFADNCARTFARERAGTRELRPHEAAGGQEVRPSEHKHGCGCAATRISVLCKLPSQFIKRYSERRAVRARSPAKPQVMAQRYSECRAVRAQLRSEAAGAELCVIAHTELCVIAHMICTMQKKVLFYKRVCPFARMIAWLIDPPALSENETRDNSKR